MEIFCFTQNTPLSLYRYRQITAISMCIAVNYGHVDLFRDFFSKRIRARRMPIIYVLRSCQNVGSTDSARVRRSFPMIYGIIALADQAGIIQANSKLNVMSAHIKRFSLFYSVNMTAGYSHEYYLYRLLFNWCLLIAQLYISSQVNKFRVISHCGKCSEVVIMNKAVNNISALELHCAANTTLIDLSDYLLNIVFYAEKTFDWIGQFLVKYKSESDILVHITETLLELTRFLFNLS